MLIRFIASNFLSFGEEQEFNMLPGDFRTLKHHVYATGKVEVLKAAAIYGANGAGKSNLIKGLAFLQDLVKAGRLTQSIDGFKFKLNPENSEKAIDFEIEFFLNRIQKVFKYRISLNHGRIETEWLYESGITGNDKVIFHRYIDTNGKTKVDFKPSFLTSKTENKLLKKLLEDKLLKDNELLLSKNVVGLTEIELSLDWFRNKLTIIYPQSKFAGLVNALSHSERFRDFSSDLMDSFDTGIVSLNTRSVDLFAYFGEDDRVMAENIISELERSEGDVVINAGEETVLATKENGKYIIKRTVTIHRDETGQDIQFDLKDESDGTRRILDLLPVVDLILRDHCTIVIDEIDQSLHVSLLKTLIHKIMDDKDTLGQLIFTTHECNLLDLALFRQDEIWFAEKNRTTQSTVLYSLSDFKPRPDLDIRKGYLKGRYGGIPFLARLEDLNWNLYETNAS